MSVAATSEAALTAAALLSHELRDIEQASSDGVDRAEHKLRQLRQRGGQQHLVEEEYAGRYPFELLQNANDAGASAGEEISVRFDITDTALIVSNMGKAFGPDEVHAICDLGASSKDPAKHVGYKGLGFKSVAEITDTPQIWSSEVAFHFDATRAKKDVERALQIEVDVWLPVYAFPYPCEAGEAGADLQLLKELRDDGYTTSIRLPYRTTGLRERVRSHVVDLIGPRLLLFLGAVHELVVQGTGESDFVALKESQDLGDGLRRVDLLWGQDAAEEWFVHSRTAPVPSEIREGFDDAWSRVHEVRVGCGVRIGASDDETFPLHVYFPTEIAMPFRALAHGDFMLGLDRRHLKQTGSAQAYNAWLAGELGGLMAATAERVGSVKRDETGIAAVAPRAGAAAKVAKTILESLVAALDKKDIIPTLAGGVVSADQARGLPLGLDASGAFDLLDLMEHSQQLATLAVHCDEELLAWAEESLGLPRLGVDVVAPAFGALPADRASEGYRLLHAWHRRHHRVRAVADQVEYVVTTSGERRRPKEVFLPPQAALRGEWDPDQVELAVVDGDDDELLEILAALGVEAFDRQKIIELQILPPLRSEETDHELRGRCHRVLREYLADGMGDKALRSRLGQVLVRARAVDDERGSDPLWQRADKTYFSRRWLRHGHQLEAIYGPFGAPEFLAEEPAEDAEEHAELVEYFKALGVRAEPRPDVAETTTHDQYKVGRSWQHPHHKVEPEIFTAWLEDDEVAAAAECPTGWHTESQQIRRSVIVDRLPQILRHGTREQRAALFHVLAVRWSDVYRPLVNAQFHCQVKQSHGGVKRTRSSPALFAWLLKNEPWVPATVGDTPVDAQTPNVWLLDEAGATQGAQLLLPTPAAPDTDPVDIRVMARDIGLLAPDSITVAGVLGQLRRLAAAYSLSELPNDSSTRPLRGVARWMLNLLRAAASRSKDAVDLGDVPLLTHRGDALTYDVGGYASPDATLRNRWRARVPVLLADDSVHSWIIDFGWRDLEASVEVAPRPHERDADATEKLALALERLYPYIAAVATDGAASRETTTLPRLRSLKVVVCDELWLDESIDGTAIEPSRVRTYLKARTERRGSVNRRTGTLFVERSAQHENIEIGSQLAAYLELARGEGAALSLVLEGEDMARRLLESRGVPAVVVADLAQKLGAPVPDSTIVFELPVEEPGGLPPVRAADEPEDAPRASQPSPPVEDSADTDGDQRESGGDDAEPPPLDPSAIRAFEVSTDTTVEIKSTRLKERPRPGGGSGGRRTEDDRVDQARTSVVLGDRGEEAAYYFERRRLEDLGRDPNDAEWDAERDEWSPYDLTSFDDDGQLVYIEVKSTKEDDPTRPFRISARQLEYAARYRGSFWIYRVVNTFSSSPIVYRYRDPLGQGAFVGESALMRLPGLPNGD